MIILFTSKNIASKNIAEKLIENHGFVESGENKWKCGETEMIETNAETVLDVPTDYDTDLILVLSTHKSKAGGRMITAHFPGNWNDAKFGGTPKTLNVAYGSKLKLLIRELKEANSDLDWPLFIEADHHGPTCNVPIMFVEIGSTEEEWNNEQAAEVVAKAVSEFLKKDEKFKSVLGIGGGHYSREFTKLLLETELAVGHVAPKYAIDQLDESVFMQAIEKNVEKIEKVIILKKETNSSQKKKIIELVEKCGLTYELL